MKTRFSIAAIAGLISIALALASCSHANVKTDDYFPLRQGMSWTYTFRASNGASGQLVTTNLAPVKLFGMMVVPQQNSGPQKSYKQYYVKEKSGVRNAGLDTQHGTESRMGDHSYVIKYPVRVGTTWKEIDRTMDGTIFQATTTIESVNDKITVPAGTFSGCVRIRSTGVASPVTGASFRTIGAFSPVAGGPTDVRDYYWLAPGVGPVKATHTESRGSGPAAQSMSIVMVLDQFKH